MFRVAMMGGAMPHAKQESNFPSGLDKMTQASPKDDSYLCGPGVSFEETKQKRPLP
jgi:hypothetical protein